VDPVVNPGELEGCIIQETAHESQQQKNLKILQSFAERPPGTKTKKLHLRFLVSPTEVIADSDGNVAAIKLEKNRLQIQPDGTASARGIGEFETLDIGMVLPAIGFSLERIAGVPYDEKARIIANEDGRVVDPVSRSVIANEYVVGWARTGAQGLIGSHKAASAHVVAHMVADGARLAARELPDREAILALLRERGLQMVSFDDWKQLDEVEVARGERRDAPRDKIVDVGTMLDILARR
ncbi:MAG: NADP oxidoreductase, partial [Sideroxyarcus sp.]